MPARIRTRLELTPGRMALGHPGLMLKDDDGVAIVNSTQEVRWRADHFQVTLCQGCWTEGCQAGGWVTARRYGDLLVWMPAFRAIDEGPWEATAFAPPLTGSPDGCFVFGADAIKLVVANIPGHPQLEELPPLSVWEALRIVKEAAPGWSLGRHPETIRLRRDLVLASEPFDLGETTQALERLIQAPDGALDPPSPQADLTTLYLDLTGTPGWSPLCRDGSTWRLTPFGVPSLE